MSGIKMDPRAVTVLVTALKDLPWITPRETESYYGTLASQYGAVCGEPVVPNGASGARFAESIGGYFSRPGWEVSGAPIPLFSTRQLDNYTQYLDGGRNCPMGSPAQRTPALVAELDKVKKGVIMTSMLAGSDWKSLMSELGLNGYSGSKTLENRLVGTAAKIQKALRATDHDEADIEALERLLSIMNDPARGRLGYLLLAAIGGIGTVPAGYEDIYEIVKSLIAEDEAPDEGTEGGGTASPAGGGGNGNVPSASGTGRVIGTISVDRVDSSVMLNRGFGPNAQQPMNPLTLQTLNFQRSWQLLQSGALMMQLRLMQGGMMNRSLMLV